MYRIRSAAARAGLSAGLLRAWERRYALVAPTRTSSGYRVYSDDDIRLLRGAKKLVDGGLSIAEVARLPREALLDAAAPQEERAPEPDGEPATTAPAEAEALEAIRAFDAPRLERWLYRAMGMGTLAPFEICERVLLPLLAAIGDRWETGELTVAAEHFGSSIVRAKLVHLVEMEARRRPDAPVLVCACPDGEAHEGALLAFAVHAGGLGYHVLYLGADTPLVEVLAAADAKDARALALSVTRPIKDSELPGWIERLARWRNARPGRRVLVGGRGALPRRDALHAAGIETPGQIAAFRM